MPLNYKVRAIASVAAFLVSSYVATQVLEISKGPCAGDWMKPFLPCVPARFGDLGYVDYLVIVAVGLGAVAFVWFVTGKFGRRT